jgi:hypothetical protein
MPVVKPTESFPKVSWKFGPRACFNIRHSTFEHRYFIVPRVSDVTRILKAAQQGDPRAAEPLLQQVLQ